MRWRHCISALLVLVLTSAPPPLPSSALEGTRGKVGTPRNDWPFNDTDTEVGTPENDSSLNFTEIDSVEVTTTETATTTQVSCTAEHVHLDMAGRTVQITTCVGTSEAELDESCCNKCDALAECTFWVRDNVRECYLRTDFIGYIPDAWRRGTHKAGCLDSICSARSVAVPGVVGTVEAAAVHHKGVQILDCPAPYTGAATVRCDCGGAFTSSHTCELNATTTTLTPEVPTETSQTITSGTVTTRDAVGARAADPATYPSSDILRNSVSAVAFTFPIIAGACFVFFCCAPLICLVFCGAKRRDARRTSAVADSPGGGQPGNEALRGAGIGLAPLDEVPAATPPYWNCRDANCWDTKRVNVKQAEQDLLQELLDGTFQKTRTRDRKDGDMPAGLKIVQASRVENTALWKTYARQRWCLGSSMRPSGYTALSPSHGSEVMTNSNEMCKKGELDRKLNEFYLWHGTSRSGAMAITSEGFDLDLAGSNAGAMYGCGIYLAECCSKADEYSEDEKHGPDKGVRCILLCRVVLGEILKMTTGGSGTHAMIKAALDTGTYHSILGDRAVLKSTYREFIVYKEAQVYPEYMVYYRRVFELLG